MNRSVLRAAVYTRTGIPTTDGLITSTVVNDILNDANHALETEHDWPWHEAVATITTAAGTDQYTPPADWRRTKRLRLTGASGYVLERVEIDELEATYDDVTQGVPEKYATWGDKLFLRPVPNGVLSIQHRYLKTEPDMDDDADSPLAPTPFHSAIVDQACGLALTRARRSDDAADAFARYERWLARMRDDVRRHSGPGRISLRSEW